MTSYVNSFISCKDIKEKKDYVMTLVRKQLIQLAKTQYHGNWLMASRIFDLYEFLGDLKNKALFNEVINTRDLSEVHSLWKSILKEHTKHITINQELADSISSILLKIEPYIYKNETNTNALLNLAVRPTYKQLVQNLILYIKDFFNSLNIKVKTLADKSNVTQLKIFHIIPDLSPSEEVISEVSFRNKKIQDSLMKSVKKEMSKNDLTLEEVDGYYRVLNKDYQEVGFILPNEPTVIYPTEQEVLNILNDKKEIDNIYDTLTFSKGKLIDPDGDVVAHVSYIENVDTAVARYNIYVDSYNSRLSSYEEKLSNNPTPIKLNDNFVVKVQKVFDKNIPRPIIVEGIYKGLFLDQIVSSTGKILGSNSIASPYFSQSKQIIESIEPSKYELKEKETSKINLMSDYETSFNPYTYRLQYVSYAEKLNLHPDMIPILPNLTGLSIVHDIYKDPSKYNLRLDVYKDEVLQQIHSKEMYIERRIIPDSKTIENRIFTSNKCLPDGLGSKIFIQEVKTAQENGFKFIETEAAGFYTNGIYVGYYVWPKLGYNCRVSLEDLKNRINRNFPPLFSPTQIEYNLNKLEQIKKWLSRHNLINSFGETDILDLYACKIDGKFAGQDIWYKYGSSVDCTFNLKPNSKSMRVLNKYVELKAKKDGIPVSEFLNTDYSKYRTLSNDLDCLLEKADLNADQIIKMLPIAIRNYQNGQIIRALKNKKFINIINRDKYKIDPKVIDGLKTIARIHGIQDTESKSLLYTKLASENKEDATIKDIDFSVLDQTWDYISNTYY